MTDVSTTCVEANSSESRDLTLKMASAQVVETSVTNNSPSQDSNHPDMIFFNQGMLLLGSNHFLNNYHNTKLLQPIHNE